MELTKALYAPAEVAALVGLSSDTILSYIHAGRLFAIKLSARTYRIPQREVARFMGEAVAPSRMVVDPRGGEAAAAALQARFDSEHRKPVAR